MREITSDSSYAQRATYAIVCAQFNAPITESLLDGCAAYFAKAGVKPAQLTLVRVPGAFEIVPTAKLLIETGNYAAIVCLGAVVRGATPHFDYVAGECARGIATLSRNALVPVIFGVITTDTWAQAEERAQPGLQNNKGADGAQAAIEMAGLFEAIRRTGQSDKTTRADSEDGPGFSRSHSQKRSAPRK